MKKLRNPRYTTQPVRLFPAVLLALMLTFLFSFGAQAAVTSTAGVKTVTGGSFVKRAGNWYYQTGDDGSYLKDRLAKINGNIYYFSPKGVRLYGIQDIGKYTYYFGTEDEGYMYRSKWYYQSATKVYYFPKNGRMVKKKWLTLDGKNYYFNKNGVRVYGFKTLSKKRYYFGTAQEGYQYKDTFFLYNKQYYYAQEDGVIATGRIELNGNAYYFYDDGHAYSGKLKLDGKTHYFSDYGQLLKVGANLTVNSDSAILVRVSNSKQIFAKNADIAHGSAGTSAILTAVLALEKKDLTDEVTISTAAAKVPSPKLYASEGEVFVLEDLIYATMLDSDNEAAVAIAESVSTTEKKFVKQLNKKAKAIGCTNTVFGSASGLDDDVTHYTTCEDLAKIAIYAYKDPTFRKIAQSRYHNFQNKAGESYSVITDNQLLAQGTPGVIGMKTGHTAKSGYCMIGLVKTKKNRVYLSVVLGGNTSEQCLEDTKTLLDYAYNKY